MKKFIILILACSIINTCGVSIARDDLNKSFSRSSKIFTEKNSTFSVFEGRYKVGNTTCTVVPIKMAFEVKWEKGKGSMAFFFNETTDDGKYIFVSEESKEGKDKFVFDNDHYDAGVFIRADGKEFTVEK